MKRLAAAILLSLLMTGFWFPSSGHAACFSPAGPVRGRAQLLKRLCPAGILVLFLLALFDPRAAHASCFNPAGNAGDVIYYGAYQSDMYCDGGAWVSMGGPVGNTTNGLVGWWKLDDGSGTSAADSSGSGYTGTLTGSPVPTWTTGIYGGALTLDGTQNYVLLPAGLSLGTTYTLAAWVYVTSAPTSGFGGQVILIGPGTQGETLAISPSLHPKLGAYMAETGSFATYVVTATGTIGLNAWHHIASVVSGTTVSIYIDGVLDKSTTVPDTGTSGSGTSYIGRYTSPFNGWAGSVDDARVYSRALSAADIKTLYTSTGGTSGDIQSNLVGYWKFDEASGTNAADSSGSSMTGTLTGTPVWTTSGKINGALSFNAAHPDQVTTPPGIYLGASSFTCAAWINTTQLVTQARILGGESNSSNGYFWLDESQGGTTGFTLEINPETPSDHQNFSSLVNISDGLWHHVAAVVDRSANTVSIYVDGVVRSTTSHTFAGNFGTSGFPLSFEIGDQGQSLSLAYTGTIDEVRVYNRALSASDVLTLYNTTATACASPAGYTGDLVYSNDSHVPQFCNGASWIPAGPVPGAGGGGCSSPTGAEGSFVYNADNHVLQYCDGANWVAAGENIPISGLVGWWNFDEASGTIANDSSSSGNTGTLTNGPTWTTGGKINGALVFAQASNNYVDVANPANFNFERTQPFTVAAWVYRTSTTTIGAIIAKMGGPTTWQGYNLLFRADGGSGCSTCTSNCLEMALNNDVGSNNEVCISVNGSAATPNAWHHIVGTYDGSSTAAGTHIYVDGVLQAPSHIIDALTASILNGMDLKIGANVPTAGNSFTGTIDDVRVYNRALSAAEVWRLYNGAP